MQLLAEIAISSMLHDMTNTSGQRYFYKNEYAIYGNRLFSNDGLSTVLANLQSHVVSLYLPLTLLHSNVFVHHRNIQTNNASFLSTITDNVQELNDP